MQSLGLARPFVEFGSTSAVAVSDYDPEAHGARCNVCPLKGSIVVPPAPSYHPTRLVIVGEAPGRIEELKKTPFCLVPSTLVLMADLTWKPLGEVSIGDEIITIDENAPIGGGYTGFMSRRWCIATVTAKHTSKREVWRFDTEAGSLTGTKDHRVLAAYKKAVKGTKYTNYSHRWRALGSLQCSKTRSGRITYIGAPWKPVTTYDAGWLAGFLDGEGHVLGSKSLRVKRAGWVGYAQNTGPVFDRAQCVTNRLGFVLKAHEKRRKYAPSGKICWVCNFRGDLPEMMRLLGTIRPTRLISDFQSILRRPASIRPTSKKLKAPKLISKVGLGLQDVVDITTTSGTFIANGFVVHNCGPAGKLLNRVLSEASIRRSEAHVTNAMLCRAPNDSDIFKADAAACCAERLARELEELAPVPILSMGSWGTRSTLGVRSVMRARGFVWTNPEISKKKIEQARKALAKAEASTGKKKDAQVKSREHTLWGLEARARLAGRVQIATLHPAFILRGADFWFPILTQDVCRMGRLVEQGKLDLQDEYAYRTHKVAGTIREVKKQFARLQGNEWNVDVETEGVDPLHTKLLCVGVSDGRRTVVIYPWRKELASTVNRAFKSKTVVTHYGPQFDHLVLERHGVEVHKWEDTLLAYHAFASQLPKRLAHLVSTYVDSGPWKILAGKSGGAEEKEIAPWEKGDKALTSYNAADVVLAMLVWQRMQPDLELERKTYENDKRVALMCKRMRKAGIRIDAKKREELSLALKRRQSRLLDELRKLTGKRSFSPYRLNDIRYALFSKFRSRVLRQTPKGLASTGKETLEALSGNDTRAGKLADLLLRYRSAGKTKSTFVDGPDIDRRGYLHPGWKMGPVTGRLACSPYSLMNLPRAGKDLEQQVRALYVPSKNRVATLVAQIHDAAIIDVGGQFVYFDLSQAEARAAAFLSGDENLIKACEKDIHAANARVVFRHSKPITTMLEIDAKGKLSAMRMAGASDEEILVKAGKLTQDDLERLWKACAADKRGGGFGIPVKYRDIAKNCGFAVWYEGSVERIYITLVQAGFAPEMSSCQGIYDAFHDEYVRYYEYIRENVAYVRKHGHLRTALLGRIRWLGWYAPETEIANFPIQSFIADLMNDRLVRIEEKLVSCGRSVDAVKELITETWAEPIFVPTSGLTFTMPIDLKVADRWSNL